jgi:hypothetical protein
MCQITHRLTLAILLGLTLACPTSRANACSCVPQSLSEAFENSDLIFQGTVIQITAVESEGWLSHWIVTLSQEKSWKSDKDNVTLTVLDPPHEAVCGFGFYVGETYLVYAQRDTTAEAYRTSLCSRTTRLRDDLPDIPFLDAVVATEQTSWHRIKRLYATD